MRLNPEEIEARRFRLAPNGYECEAVDRFLAEITEALRNPPLTTPETDEFGRVGQEIATILRAARDSAGAMRAEAEGLAASVRSRAELEAVDVRKQAEKDRDEAKQILDEAHAKGDVVINEAQKQAAASLSAATEQARARAAQITARAERQAEQIRRGERAAHQRLLAARTDLQQAIDRLVGTDDQPVLDLTTAPPHVRTGGIRREPLVAGGDQTAVDADETEIGSRHGDPATGGDPLLRMVRAAVGRAVEGSASDPALIDEEAPAV